MKSRLFTISIVFVLFLLLGMSGAQANSISVVQPQAPVGSAFTYQGQLDNNNIPVNGTCDFIFSLWTAASGGSKIPPDQNIPAQVISKGLFTVQLDWDSPAFSGESRWFEIQVRCPAGSGAYTTLTPRQQVSPAPYSVYSSNTGALQGKPLSTAEPSLNQQLIFKGSSWEPQSGHWGETWSGTSAPGLGLVGSTNDITATVTGGKYSSAIVGKNLDTISCKFASGLTGIQGNTTNPFCDSAGIIGLGNDTGVFGLGDLYGTGGISQGEDGIGLFGRSDGVNGLGVYGWATSDTGYNSGVYGTSESDIGVGVYGIAQNPSGNNYGVYGKSDSPNGTGVYGYTGNATANANGVTGYTNSDSGSGVMGFADQNGTHSTAGVYGRSDSDTGYGVAGHAYFNGVGVGAWSFNGNLIRAYAGDYPGGTLQFYVDHYGNVYASGSYNNFRTSSLDGETHSTASIQSTEPWLEDFGYGNLDHGIAVITIAPDFAGVTNLSVDYMVFVSLEGDCQGVYVTNKTPTTFEVHELNGGTSKVAFSYRIVARPSGTENTRLPVVAIPATINVERQPDDASVPFSPAQPPQGVPDSSTYLP